MATLFTVLLGVSASILIYFLYDFGRRDFLRETEAAIDAEISILTMMEGAEDHHEQMMNYLNNRSKHDKRVYFRFENADRHYLAGNIVLIPENVNRLKEGILYFQLMKEYTNHELAAKIYTLNNNSKILVARDIGELVASYERLQYLSGVIMILMCFVVIVSFGISYFVVSRINRIESTAQQIIYNHDLSRRIQIDTQWDDLSNLAYLLNGFLDQIESLMLGMREVSNNIAHDLRTPLAGLRSDIELMKGKQIDDRHLDRLIAETDKILRIFQSLLRITNIEQGKRTHLLVDVDLFTLLADVVELYEPLADDKGLVIKCSSEPGLIVRGDADLLFQLFTNLLDNAVKFSPEKTTVSISTAREENWISIRVIDQGSGISENEKDKVFRHFYRGDTSRSTQGNGLGLSLVKAVVEQHQGEIVLENAKPGLMITVRLQPYQ